MRISLPNEFRVMRTVIPTRTSWCFLVIMLCVAIITPSMVLAKSKNGKMTEQRALELVEQFGLDVGEVDEEIREFLGLPRAEGVVVFAVIGGTPADLAGIKVKAIIKEVDKYEITTLLDLGRALEAAMRTQNFTVATYEPADPNDPARPAGLNFHFVRVDKD